MVAVISMPTQAGKTSSIGWFHIKLYKSIDKHNFHASMSSKIGQQREGKVY